MKRKKPRKKREAQGRGQQQPRTPAFFQAQVRQIATDNFGDRGYEE
jgi:hypothetical protein